MRRSVCFVTVCGGGEDYKFLLASMEHHAAMGNHIVLDTTPPDRRLAFTGLPRSVTWIHEASFGSGWKKFDFRSALGRVTSIAAQSRAETIVHLDCDEFYSSNSSELFQKARDLDSIVAVETIHWKKDRQAYRFGPSERHRRVWPAKMPVTFPVNQKWKDSAGFDGNPNHHALVEGPPGRTRVRYVEGFYHHHVHHAIGWKADDDDNARRTVEGWPTGVFLDIAQGGVWPWPLINWRENGVDPTKRFSGYKV